ncbi:hypothetical protein EON63_08470 [archaeon]|nr:MAG: hypothetical protein EON63_08470 [archaeon]
MHHISIIHHTPYTIHQNLHTVQHSSCLKSISTSTPHSPWSCRSQRVRRPHSSTRSLDTFPSSPMGNGMEELGMWMLPYKYSSC